ncbi:hypothetical protein DFH27DRAFT_522756 [Peziza echinospora]|nr:hypothetical protein DFH27DRAFT_522756 [Peziza echinospora]
MPSQNRASPTRSLHSPRCLPGSSSCPVHCLAPYAFMQLPTAQTDHAPHITSQLAAALYRLVLPASLIPSPETFSSILSRKGQGLQRARSTLLATLTVVHLSFSRLALCIQSGYRHKKASGSLWDVCHGVYGATLGVCPGHMTGGGGCQSPTSTRTEAGTDRATAKDRYDAYTGASVFCMLELDARIFALALEWVNLKLPNQFVSITSMERQLGFVPTSVRSEGTTIASSITLRRTPSAPIPGIWSDTGEKYGVGRGTRRDTYIQLQPPATPHALQGAARNSTTTPQLAIGPRYHVNAMAQRRSCPNHVDAPWAHGHTMYQSRCRLEFEEEQLRKSLPSPLALRVCPSPALLQEPPTCTPTPVIAPLPVPLLPTIFELPPPRLQFGMDTPACL